MKDSHYMQMAIEEARKGIGLTSPNPPVGALIVKNNHVLGKGWHQKAGQAHAEREAITDALRSHTAHDLRESSIYITLEPCSTSGRTSACVDSIIEFGIKRVIYGAKDPNPSHYGQADTLLKQHGIEVVTGVLAAACESLIKPFAKTITTGLPWVIAKTAMSLDGRITRPQGEKQWLTGEEARAEVHRIRASVDAIIVGGNTVRTDNPSLTIRGGAYQPEKRQPYRVIITKQNKSTFSNNLTLFCDAYKERTLMHQNLSLVESLQQLAAMGCNTVMLECGGALMRQFLEQQYIDEVIAFVAPIFTGGEQFAFGLGGHFSHTQQLSNIRAQSFGNDLMIRGEINDS